MKGTGQLEVVAAVIRDDEGKTLVCRRPSGKGCAHLWEFPGGKIEPGETPEEALARECREELAIGIAVGGQVAETTRATDGLLIHIRYFEARITAGTLRLLEHEGARWIVASDRGELVFCPSDSMVVDGILGVPPPR